MSLGVVGDLGGTNLRLARLEPATGLPGPVWSRRCEDFPDLDAALTDFLGGPPPAGARICLALAGPVAEGAAALTNLPWRISEAGLIALGFHQATLLNDFAALALAAPRLPAADLHPIGPALTPTAGQSLVVLGPGTGFGVAGLVWSAGRPAVVASEAGHMGFAPSNDLERAILGPLSRRYGRVSIERILSGPGLADLHQALSAIHGEPDAPLEAADITAQALAGDPACRRTVSTFLDILASVAGDLALAFSARGGVLVGGGIVPRLLPLINHDAFRTRFANKGRMRPLLEAVGVHVITAPHPTLTGAAAHLTGRT